MKRGSDGPLMASLIATTGFDSIVCRRFPCLLVAPPNLVDTARRRPRSVPAPLDPVRGGDRRQFADRLAGPALELLAQLPADLQLDAVAGGR